MRNVLLISLLERIKNENILLIMKELFPDINLDEVIQKIIKLSDRQVHALNAIDDKNGFAIVLYNNLTHLKLSKSTVSFLRMLRTKNLKKWCQIFAAYNGTKINKYLVKYLRKFAFNDKAMLEIEKVIFRSDFFNCDSYIIWLQILNDCTYNIKEVCDLIVESLNDNDKYDYNYLLWLIKDLGTKKNINVLKVYNLTKSGLIFDTNIPAFQLALKILDLPLEKASILEKIMCYPKCRKDIGFYIKILEEISIQKFGSLEEEMDPYIVADRFLMYAHSKRNCVEAPLKDVISSDNLEDVIKSLSTFDSNTNITSETIIRVEDKKI